MRVQRCRGTRDLSPEEMKLFRHIEAAFRECCLKWGYQEVRTPTLEYLHLFTSVGTLTPSMLSRVYSFLDWDGWSGERVVLRPDGTIPVARLFIDSMAQGGLAKLFYITNVFIFEETGKETRERWQCGAELIGAGSTAADVELITLSLETLKQLGVKGVRVKLSHAGLIKALLVKLGLTSEEQSQLFDKILDGDTAALTAIKPGEAERQKALSLLLNQKGQSAGFLKNLGALFTQSLPELDRSLNDFIRVVELLDALGIKYQIDIASGRGFEYYTGIIFQLFSGKEQIGGGGRYNALIPLMGGGDSPASGFALYIDHLMNSVTPPALPKTASLNILVRADSEKPQLLKESFAAARQLHDAGYRAEVYLGGTELDRFSMILDIQSGAPRFSLTNREQNRKLEAQTVQEVIALLEEQSVA